MDDTTDTAEESENLESLVLLTLSKLQNEKKASKKQQSFEGVSPTKIARHLKSNYCWLDGDIESQVKTSLLSCIKTGLVCILNSGKYSLVGPNSKTMVSNCVTRTSHGSKCCCISILKGFLKARTCCYIKRNQPPRKSKRKREGRPTSRQSSKGDQKKKPPNRKKTAPHCALTAQKRIGTSKSDLTIVGEIPTAKKCDYCQETHSQPKLRKLCGTCYPLGGAGGVTFDNFSPRDEH